MPAPLTTTVMAAAFLAAALGLTASAVVLGVLALIFEVFLFFVGGDDV